MIDVAVPAPSGCDPIPVEYLRWGDPEPIAAVVFACLGLMFTFFVTAVFIRYNPPRPVLCTVRHMIAVPRARQVYF